MFVKSSLQSLVYTTRGLVFVVLEPWYRNRVARFFGRGVGDNPKRLEQPRRRSDDCML
jgi:hypothetical protein